MYRKLSLLFFQKILLIQTYLINYDEEILIYNTYIASPGHELKKFKNIIGYQKKKKQSIKLHSKISKYLFFENKNQC